MADKKKNAGRSGTVPASARKEEKEQGKDVKAAAPVREREERRERENKTVRSSSSKSSPSAATRFWNSRVVRFARESYHELRYKVTWPTFEEARNMTFVVIGLSAAVGALLGLADLGLTRLVFLITGGQ